MPSPESCLTPLSSGGKFAGTRKTSAGTPRSCSRSQNARPLRCRATFGPAYEGPPGCVHGGYVAAIFDELLGATQSLSGTQGMTAHLEVDYRSPTPLGQELVLRGWLDGTEDRKIWARATLHAGDRLCAEAMALFLAFRPGAFEAMLDARDDD